ncbi:MAG TPA: DUF885 domain-containing protein [Candidatus Limnocylindrales bacterium]
MTERLTEPRADADRSTASAARFPDLPRPVAAVPGPLDDRFWALVEDRFRRIVRDHPQVATWFGIHAEDERLPDGSREMALGEIEAEHRDLAAVEALAADGLSPEVRFERELHVHNLRRSLFDLEVHRLWERRSTAMDTVGDGLFLLFARDFAPLDERLRSMTRRLEAVPAFLDESRSRAAGPQVRLWQRLEIESAGQLPGLVREVVAAGPGNLPPADQRLLERAAARATAAIGEYADWLRGTLDDGTDEWALGAEAYGELLERRAFDGLDADDILAIGEEQLAANRAARAAAARELDPDGDERTVIDRVKDDHPATFEEALAGYRDAMLRARQHIIDHRLATIPEGERISVIATPEFLRNVLPFAAYMEPPRFDRDPSGIYVVTPSVGDDPRAMREHNRSSISNTSVHEAYPGHHLQLSVANRHPSLVRLLTDAPEFVEGWGMYSEQMMREQGFDDGPAFRVALYTDAIWRACRIILDVRMHRGELSVEEATRFLVEQTSFEGPNARAEVNRYTYTPTYQLSYLVGKVLLLQLRADEQARLGSAFTLQGFHDALLRNGSLPISFHRRLIRGEA